MKKAIPKKLRLQNGMVYKLVTLRIVSRQDDDDTTPLDLVLIKDSTPVEMMSTDQYMTAYIPESMYNSEGD